MNFKNFIKTGAFVISLIINTDAGIYCNFEAGMGLVGMKTGPAVCLKPGLNVRFGDFILKARCVDIRKMLDKESSFGQYIEGGLLSGIRVRTIDPLVINIQGGLSFVYYQDEGENTDYRNSVSGRPSVTYRTIGVPVELELLVETTDVFGVGFSVVCNLNKPDSYIGCALSIHYGWLK